jgi:hypothetical protein
MRHITPRRFIQIDLLCKRREEAVRRMRVEARDASSGKREQLIRRLKKAESVSSIQARLASDSQSPKRCS